MRLSPRVRPRPAPQRELITAPAGAGIVARRSTVSHWGFAWHHHPEIELTLIEAGSGVRYVGDSVQPFGPGDCVLLGSDLPHTWTSQPTPGRPQRSVVIQFPPSLGIAQSPEAIRLHSLLRRAGQGLALRGELARSTAVAMGQLADSGDPLERLAHLLLILSRIARAQSTNVQALAAQAVAAPHDARLAHVLALVHQRAAAPLSMPAAAAAAGLSPTAFSRWFHRATGRTFIAYRVQVQVGLACRALAETRRPITAIALDAGFGNLANFNRHFRACTHSTPSAYRRAQQMQNT